MRIPPSTTIDFLLEQYDTLLLDAYGVLVDKQGPLPGAVQLIERLNRQQHNYLLLTNSASRLPEALAADFNQAGLAIDPERIISSGMLLEPLFRQRDLRGATCLVLGPDDALEYVRRAGGIALRPGRGCDADVVIIADQKGFDLQPGLDDTISLLLRRFDADKRTELILCNPDQIYPVDEQRYGFTSGALSAMLESILAERYPDQPPRFLPLGKPHSPIFEAASKRTTGQMVMLGDQLATDILGASDFGIDSVLVMTGLTRQLPSATGIIPDFILPSLES